jgi:hypothetical protein
MYRNILRRIVIKPSKQERHYSGPLIRQHRHSVQHRIKHHSFHEMFKWPRHTMKMSKIQPSNIRIKNVVEFGRRVSVAWTSDDVTLTTCRTNPATNAYVTFVSLRRQSCFWSTPDNMSENRYCEPCARFLRGEITITRQYTDVVTFEHHREFQSFDAALRMPCVICSLAWTYATNPPTMENWVGMLGTYCFGFPEPNLSFDTERVRGKKPYSSDILSLVRWPSK